MTRLCSPQSLINSLLDKLNNDLQKVNERAFQRKMRFNLDSRKQAQ